MPIGSGKADFGLVTAAGFELPWEVGVDVNAGLAAVGQSRPSGHIVQPLASAVVTRELGGGLVPFPEAFFSSREERDARHTLGVGAGVVWRLTPRVAVDAAVGTSLAGNLPDVVARAGVSVRPGR